MQVLSLEYLSLSAYATKYDLSIKTVEKQKSNGQFYDGWVWDRVKNKLSRSNH